MATTSVTHGETGARIAGTLRDAILAGDYLPGERIRQDELAERHGASRLPVREALRMLEAEGLVRLVANTGAWVSEISAEECQEMYQMRERLEPLLLRMNVPSLDDADIERLQKLADAMELSDDVEDFLRLDREFHLSCLDAAARRACSASPCDPCGTAPSTTDGRRRVCSTRTATAACTMTIS